MGSMIRLTIMDPPEPTSPRFNELKNAKLDSIFDFSLQWAPAKLDSLSHTNRQAGQVNGIPFMRADVTGRGKPDGEEIQGVTYIGKDGAAVIILTFIDAKSHYADSVKLGTSAILTFRKKP